MNCDWCEGTHPPDVGCKLPRGNHHWVLWGHGGYTWVAPTRTEDDALAAIALIEQRHGSAGFEDGRRKPRIVRKRPENFPQGRPRILRLMREPSRSIWRHRTPDGVLLAYEWRKAPEDDPQ